jgi:hypothetical protein
MMSDSKGQKFALVKMPSFTRLLIGGMMAYWLSTIMNPAFVAIAVLVVLLIPVLTVDNMFSSQFSRAYRQPEQVKPKVMSKSEYIESKTAAAAKPASEPVAATSTKPQKNEKKSKSKK